MEYPYLLTGSDIVCTQALKNHKAELQNEAALLFWFFGGFRCGVPLFIVMLVIY